MAEKNLIKLAKGGNKITKAPIAKKPVVKVDKKPITPAEERDIKAKAKVEELLQSVELTPNKIIKEDTPVIVHEKREGIEWLEEQVTLLSEQSETLRNELAQAKDDYARLFQDFNNKKGNSNNMLNETIVQNILLLFSELSANASGNNPEKTIWKTVEIRYLIMQMLQLFPFLEKYKKF